MYSEHPSVPIELSYCACGSMRVAVGEYDEINPDAPKGEGYFYLHIMCGECHTWRYVEAHENACDAWEEDFLEPGQAAIQRDANRINKDRFKDWAATFIVALKHDLLGPDDFVGKTT